MLHGWIKNGSSATFQQTITEYLLGKCMFCLKEVKVQKDINRVSQLL